LYPIHFYGRVAQSVDGHGRLVFDWVDTQTVMAMAYDTPVPGYHNNTVNNMRLWSAKSSREFDLDYFNHGDYERAVSDKDRSETISKVLYPNDNVFEGRDLRLKQEYFFVAATLQDIIRRYKKGRSDSKGRSDNKGRSGLEGAARNGGAARLSGGDGGSPEDRGAPGSPGFSDFHDQVAVQLNDTHPAVAILELMRLLVDKEGLDWEPAWETTVKVFGYTNHTILPEALEQWPVSLFGRVLPRHLQIAYEINRRFLALAAGGCPGDTERLRRMSLFDENGEKKLRMSHLAIVGSHSVNGVSGLHTEILKTEIFRDFFKLWPERFNNKTNGITPRRWLKLCNPGLAQLITDSIGDGWVTDLEQLSRLVPLAENTEFRRTWRAVKEENKKALAKTIRALTNVSVDTDALFDCQVKRIHEYKRQLLNVLHVLSMYLGLKADPEKRRVPRVVIFAGKAAPGYAAAKLIIRLIHAVAEK